MARSTHPGGEIRALTGLRIVAALWVVLIHFQGVISDSWGSVGVSIRPLVMSGWLGVDLFFLLSGFVLTWSYLQRMGDSWNTKATLAFLWARLIRIWPLWALLTIAAAAFLLVTGWDQGTVGAYPRVVTPRALLEQLGLVQMWTRHLNLGSSFVAPGWSLSVELAAYVAFPLLILIAHRLRRLPLGVLMVSAVAPMAPMCVLAYEGGLADYWLPWQIRIFGAFTSGMFTCLVVLRLRSSTAAERWAPLLAAAAVLEIGIFVVWADARVVAGDTNRLGVAVAMFPVLVGALALSERGLANHLSRDVMVLGGRVSFALYLVHCLLLDVFQWTQTQVDFLAPGRPAAAFIEANLVILCIVVAWGLWRWVEEPARAWLRDRGPGRPRAQEVEQANRRCRGGPPSGLPQGTAVGRDSAEQPTLIAARSLPRPPSVAMRPPVAPQTSTRRETVGPRA